MRRLLFFLICLAGIFSSWVSAQNTDNQTLPLCQQFRVLGGLPWNEPAAARKTVLERIFNEPNLLVRHEVLREYLEKVLPVEEFPAAFDECIVLEQADFPDAVGQYVMRAWAERDPASAIARCQTLFPVMIEGAPLDFDEWSKPIQIQDLEKARASAFWFGDRAVAHACWKGMAAATLTPERRKELEHAFLDGYFRRFQEQPPKNIEEPSAFWARRYRRGWVDTPPTIGSDEKLRADFFRLLSAPPDEIAGLIQWPGRPWDDITLPRAMIRWMNGDAKKAPQIIEHVLDAYDPQGFYRSDSETMRIIPTGFLVEWAIVDRASLLHWVEIGRMGWRAEAVRMAIGAPPSDEEFFRFRQRLDGEAELPKARLLWLALNPGGALARSYRYRDDLDLDEALDDLWRDGPPANYWRRAIVPLIENKQLGSSNEAWGVTTVWGPVDFADMVTNYGMRWCLSGNDFKKEKLPGMLMNRQALENDSGLRHTLSALRTWAILRLKEMRTWMDTQLFEPGIREALVWLMENARGGFADPPTEKTP